MPAHDVERASAQDGNVAGAVILPVARGVFSERHVELPVQGIFNGPVGTDGLQQDLWRRYPGQREGAGPFLPFRANAVLHAALPYLGLLLVFTVWSQLSWHFNQCYIPYQTWLFGFPGGDPFDF